MSWLSSLRDIPPEFDTYISYILRDYGLEEYNTFFVAYDCQTAEECREISPEVLGKIVIDQADQDMLWAAFRIY